MIVIDAEKGKRISLGRIGENETRVVRFNISDIVVNFPEAEFTLLNRRPNDVYAYPVSSQYISVEGGTLYWTIQSGDLAVDGIGECEIKAEQNGKIVKTVIWMTCVLRALDGSANPPQPWESWVEQVEDAAEDATAAAALLENASAEAETLDPGESATASYANGVFSFGIPRGAAGQDGQDGRDGSDGRDGTDGAPGADGFSPSASVSKSGDTATITITDKDGTTTAVVKDGYQPVQWELIREDSQTNATEADITIDVDGNGQPFELTDVRLLFWTPVQDVASGKGDYGRVFLYDANNVQRNGFYWNAWTQAANASARIAMGEIIQEGGMIETTFTKNTTDTGDTQIYATLRIGQSDPRFWMMPAEPHVYTRIVIKKVTGKGAYRLYGKRKV